MSTTEVTESAAADVAATKSWRLGIVSGTLGARLPDGRVVINHSLGRLLDEFRRHAPAARICMPILPEREQNMNYVLDYSPEAIVPLPPLCSTISAQKHYWSSRRIVRRFAAEHDVQFFRLPFQLPSALRNLGKPKVVHVVSNPVQVIRASNDYRGLMKFLALRFAAHSEAAMRRLVAEPATRAVTNGREMWDKLGCRAGRVAVSSCLQRSEMRPRDDLRLNDPPRLLFVGYLRPEKGIESLLEAFTMLRRTRPLQLTLVGGTDRKTGAERRISDAIESNPFRADIRMTGIMDFGEPLFNLYREHDVYVLPSLSEGTPRTLVEARCFGCPVVATRVGGIPTSVTDGVDGLLVEPNAPAALAESIARVLDDDGLRRKLIETGLRRADEFSLERFAADIVAEMQLALEAGTSSARRS